MKEIGKQEETGMPGKMMERSLPEKTRLPEQRQDPNWLQMAMKKARKQTDSGKPGLLQERPGSEAGRSLIFWRMIPEADAGIYP